MCGMIRNGIIKERVRVTSFVENMVEIRFRWLGHVEKRYVDYVVRKTDLMKCNQITRD
jgi:hypothetical protein